MAEAQCGVLQRNSQDDVSEEAQSAPPAIEDANETPDPSNDSNTGIPFKPTAALDECEEEEKPGHTNGVVVSDVDESVREQVGFDVIGIHGLLGQSWDSWKTTGSGPRASTWLRDICRNVDGKLARVVLYGYETSEQYGNCYTSWGVQREAQSLLDKLLELRTLDVMSAGRPIIFVSHDIGGLVVKAALILATSNKAKFADILYSTRSIIFLGYPHRPLSLDDLEEQLFRLLSLAKGRYRPGSMIRLARTLAETIDDINSGFIHTKMLTQAILLNMYSTNGVISDRVFDELTATMHTPRELRIPIETEHVAMCRCLDSDFHPIMDLLNEGWQGRYIVDIVKRMSHHVQIIRPLRRGENAGDDAALIDLLKAKESRILLVQCSQPTPIAWEAMQKMRHGSSMLLFFSFDAHDIRQNNMRAALKSFIVQSIFHHPGGSGPTIKAISDRLQHTGGWTTEDLFCYCRELRELLDIQTTYVLECFDECDQSSLSFLSAMKKHLAGTEEDIRFIITTTKGSKGDLQIEDSLSTQFTSRVDYPPQDVTTAHIGFELSRLSQREPRYSFQHLQKAITTLTESFSGDEDLYRLLINWLQSSRDPLRSMSGLVENSTTRGPELLFERILSSMPAAFCRWAQRMLSWVLSALRPLRVFEFCAVSDLCLISEELKDDSMKEGNSSTYHRIKHILRPFGGILVVCYDEVKFCHPRVRQWTELSSINGSPSVSNEWYRKTEHDRQIDILETCLAFIRGNEREVESWHSKLPYAVEFWPMHLKQVGSFIDVLETIFDDPVIFTRWIDAYASLPAIFERIPNRSRKPLPAAAHFGLDSLIISLSEGCQNDFDAHGLALIEAARTGQLSSVRLLLGYFSCRLIYDNIYLHDAVEVASLQEEHELFRELVEFISLPSSKPRDGITRVGIDVENDDSNDRLVGNPDKKLKHDRPKDRNPVDDSGINIFENECNPEAGAGLRDNDAESPDPKSSNDALLHEQKPGSQDLGFWMAGPLMRACCLGLEDVVSKFLALGASHSSSDAEHATPLHHAGRMGQAGVAQVLLEAGAKPTARTRSAKTPLHWAAISGGHDVVEILLRFGAASDVKDDDGWEPLHHACYVGSFLVARAILSRYNFKDGLPDAAYWTPLLLASARNHVKIVNDLLQRGADANGICNGAKPLIAASYYGYLDTIRLLLDKNAEIDKTEEAEGLFGHNALLSAASRGNREVAQYLISRNADVNVRTREDFNAVYLASSSGFTEIVRILAEKGKADVNSVVGDEAWTPLHAAYKHPTTVSALIELGADTTREARDGESPLDLAIQFNQPETCKVLLQKPHDKPDLTRSSTQKALRNAVKWCFTEVVSLLLRAGADVNIVDKENTPLMSLALFTKNESEVMVRTILEFHPDLTLKDKYKNTPLHFISHQTTVESARLLVIAGCEVDGINEVDFSPLTVAICCCNDEVVRYLLTRKAVLCTLPLPVFEYSGTPLHIACRRGTSSMVKWLIESGSDTNYQCTGYNGTPLIAASLRPNKKRDSEREKIFTLLLENGADPNVGAGIFGYPIISASFGCPTNIIEKLLDRKASIDVQDCCGRKPAHVACYNGLDVLNVLKVPDTDFAARDFTGRVPLHYAVLSRQIDLLKEVLARSLRAGISINVKDEDGWTPLMWAARAADLDVKLMKPRTTCDELVTYLFENGANVCISGFGLDHEWTALEVAKYHGYDFDFDNITTLAETHNSSQRKPSRPIKRGERWAGGTCDVCCLEIWGFYYHCMNCGHYDLCFKCYWSKDAVHPHHTFSRRGSERVEQEDTADKDESLAEKIAWSDLEGGLEFELAGDGDSPAATGGGEH